MQDPGGHDSRQLVLIWRCTQARHFVTVDYSFCRQFNHRKKDIVSQCGINISVMRKNKLEEKIDKIDQRLLQFKEYKKCLCYGDDLLRESIIKMLRGGFGYEIDDSDELKDDFKIIDNEGKPLILVEVKGTNKGITRQHINQTDSHRERAHKYLSTISIT